MKTIAVIYGGKSVEHDISIITGLTVMKNLGAGYELIPIYITRHGEWLTREKLAEPKSYKDFNVNGLCKCWLEPGNPRLCVRSRFRIRKEKIDAAILALHGTNGEDGTVQGLLQLSAIPYTGPGVTGSGICMDKVISKMLFTENKIKTLKFDYFISKEYREDPDKICDSLEVKLGYPMIVKPARAGSSIGIARANNRAELNTAISVACEFDVKVIVEEALSDYREINISAIKLDDTIQLSDMEEVMAESELFTFEDKYLVSKSQNTKRIIPANLDLSIQNKIMKTAAQAYEVCDCAGIVRLDFLIADDKVYLNEINTIPGSLAYPMWRGKGYTMGKLLSRSIEQAIADYEAKNDLIYNYHTEALINIDEINLKMNK